MGVAADGARQRAIASSRPPRRDYLPRISIAPFVVETSMRGPPPFRRPARRRRVRSPSTSSSRPLTSMPPFVHVACRSAFESDGMLHRHAAVRRRHVDGLGHRRELEIDAAVRRGRPHFAAEPASVDLRRWSSTSWRRASRPRRALRRSSSAAPPARTRARGWCSGLRRRRGRTTAALTLRFQPDAIGGDVFHHLDLLQHLFRGLGRARARDALGASLPPDRRSTSTRMKPLVFFTSRRPPSLSGYFFAQVSVACSLKPESARSQAPSAELRELAVPLPPGVQLVSASCQNQELKWHVASTGSPEGAIAVVAIPAEPPPMPLTITLPPGNRC